MGVWRSRGHGARGHCHRVCATRRLIRRTKPFQEQGTEVLCFLLSPTSLCPLLVHDPVAAVTADDRIPGAKILVFAAVCGAPRVRRGAAQPASIAQGARVNMRPAFLPPPTPPSFEPAPHASSRRQPHKNRGSQEPQGRHHELGHRAPLGQALEAEAEGRGEVPPPPGPPTTGRSSGKLRHGTCCPQQA